MLSPSSSEDGATITWDSPIALTAFKVNSSESPGPTPIPYSLLMYFFLSSTYNIYSIIAHHHVTIISIFTYMNLCYVNFIIKSF
ncbi:hypothetical protein D3C73_868670 [compost metagenome]